LTQLEYISLLFQECGFDTHAARKGFLLPRFGASYADELDSDERSRAITELKDIRDGQRDHARADWREDD